MLDAIGVGTLFPRPDSSGEAGSPAPVSRVDTAARACLLTSTDADARGTWAAMRETAGVGGSNIVVQRYRLPLRGTTYLSQDMVNASVLARLVSRRAV